MTAAICASAMTGCGPKGPELRVLTLNLAHGRADGRHQLLQRRDAILENLQRAAVCIAEANADVVALQEADGPSIWSGRFDHVAYLAEQAGYPHAAHSFHVNRAQLKYGTAVLSRRPIEDSQTLTFLPPGLTPSKGITRITVLLPVDEQCAVPVHFVSVHLDFLSPVLRRRQIDQVIESLRQVEGPMIIMGDFNTNWRKDSPLRILAAQLRLHAHEPKNGKLTTFPKINRRLDWILTSRDFRFEEQITLCPGVSDHLGVLATLQFKGHSRQHRAGRCQEVSTAPSVP